MPSRTRTWRRGRRRRFDLVTDVKQPYHGPKHDASSRSYAISSDFTDLFSEFIGAEMGLLRLDLATIPQADAKPFERTRRRSEHQLANLVSRANRPLQVHFDFIDAPELNAVAFRHRDTYFVGLNKGVLPHFFSLFSDFLTFPELLTGGQINESWPSRKPGLWIPKDELLKGRCIHLVDLACGFLVDHELGHIRNGHVDFWKDEFGLRALSERYDGSESALLLTRQVLEMDADAMAANAGIHRHIYGILNPNVYLSPWDVFYREPIDSLFNWCLATQSFFRMFGDLPFSRDSIADGLYPPVRMRNIMAQASAEEFVRHENTDLLELFQEQSARAFAIAEQAVPAVSGAKSSVEGLKDAISAEANSHANRLMAYWKDIVRPALLPFAYGPLPA